MASLSDKILIKIELSHFYHPDKLNKKVLAPSCQKKNCQIVTEIMANNSY